MKMPSTGSLALSLDEGIFTVCLNDPPDNRLRRSMFQELERCLEVMESEGVRAVVIKGSGRNFSKGADPQELRDVDVSDQEGVLRYGNEIFHALSRLKKPVVAAIDGACFGGGLELALSCHLRIASDRARLGLPELNLGLVPGLGGIQRLTRIVGEAVAMEMVLLGDLIPAARALDLRLVHRVFPRKEFEERTACWIRTILSVPQRAIQEALTLFVSARDTKETELIGQAAEAFLRLFSKASSRLPSLS